MRSVIQRVRESRVEVDGKQTGTIGHGLLVYLAIANNDTEAVARKLADKITNLRIFEDENGKMNLDLKTVGGGLLVVSQFTLYADTRKGNRPSYSLSAPPEIAKQLYDYFVEYLRSSGRKVETGIFGADMQVSYTNDGPVTIILDIDD